MDITNIVIEFANEQDLQAIQQLYSYHVLHGLGTFEEIPPSVDDMQQRFNKIVQNNLPYLVAKLNNKVVGYAYANYFRERSAYRFTLEDSIYIDPKYVGLGVGVKLMSELIKECKQRNILQLVALIGDSQNYASIKLHNKCGFKPAGVMKNVGFKFGKFVDVVIMQLNL